MKVHYTLWAVLSAFLATGLVHAQSGATVKNGTPAATSYVQKSANFGPKQGGNKRLGKDQRTAKPSDVKKYPAAQPKPAVKTSKTAGTRKASSAKVSQQRKANSGPRNGKGGKQTSKPRGGK